MTATTIEYTVSATQELLGDTRHCEGVYDVLASARAYAARVESAVEAAYPDADVSVSVVRGAVAQSVAVYVTDDDGLPGDERDIGDHVREIADRVWEDMEAWLVAVEAE